MGVEMYGGEEAQIDIVANILPRVDSAHVIPFNSITISIKIF